jgi:hypothetical protein
VHSHSIPAVRREESVKRHLVPIVLNSLWVLAIVLMPLDTGGCGKELPTPPSDSVGYERVVLCELFTAVWCGNCPLAEAALDRLTDEEGPKGSERLAVIHWHPSFGVGDPFAFAQSDERIEFYREMLGEQPGLPVNVINGADDISEGSSATYGLYRERFDRVSEFRSPVGIEITPLLEGDEAHATLRVSGFEDAGALTLDLHFVAVEHHAPNPGHVGPDSLSYTARNATSTPITVLGGECQVLDLALTLDPTWKREDLLLVAFVQEQTPVPPHTYREVLQAAMVPLLAESEDFYGFYLHSNDTDRGVTRDLTTALPFTLANTGTLADTLTLDLPASLQDLPAGFSLALVNDALESLPLPHATDLAVGATLGGVRLAVTTGSEGTAQAALVVRSHGDPALADTLHFTLLAGTFGFELGAPATDVRVIAGAETLVPFTLTGVGSLNDSLVVTLPAGLSTLPTGWEVELADAQGGELGDMVAAFIGAGATRDDLRLEVEPSSEGEGQVGIVVTSRYAPELADTLTFQVQSRLYNVVLSTSDPHLNVIVGTPQLVPFAVRNAGGSADQVWLDLPAGLQTLPVGWSVGLVYEDGTTLDLPYSLVLESGQTMEHFALRINATSGGVASVVLTARSSGDPTAADTLQFEATADAYGFELSAPGGTELSVAPGGEVIAAIHLRNVGTLTDTLVITLPLDLMDLPASWDIQFADENGELLLPYLLPLEPGVATDAYHIRVEATDAGTGTLGLVVRSTASPAIADTLAFSFSALSVYLTAEETTILVEPESPYVTAEAMFRVHNTADALQAVHLLAERVSAPAAWEAVPVICTESVCYGDTVDVNVPPNRDKVLYIHWDVPESGGTGVTRLTAYPVGNPAAAHSLVFTFTTEARAWAQLALPDRKTRTSNGRDVR